MKRFSSLFGALAVLLLLALPLAVSAEEICNHNSWTPMPTKEATCTEPGTTGGVWCSECHFIFEDPTPNADPTGHNYVSVNDQTKKCSNCGDVIEASADDNIVDMGTCGGSARWYLTDAGKLVVFGSGTVAADGLPDMSVTALVVKGGITGIAEGAFRDFSEIRTVTVADSVQSIGAGAFRGCNSIQSMTLPFTGTSEDARYPDGVFGAIFGHAEAGEPQTGGLIQYAYSTPVYFYIPSSISSVTITSASCIGAAAFENMAQLTSLSLNEGIDTLDAMAFHNCSGLTELTIPSTVTTVYGGAFEDCTGLTKLTFSEKLESLGKNAFEGCTNLKEVTFLGDVPKTNGSPFAWYDNTINYPCQYSGWKTVRLEDSYAKLNPIHPEDKIIAVKDAAATCTEPGIKAGEKCSACEAILTGCEEIPAAGHTLGTHHDEVPATCKENGTMAFNDCGRSCGAKLDAEGNELTDVVIPATKLHTPEIIPQVEPTCTEQGLREGSKCSVCGDILIPQETIDKLPHTPGQKHDAKPETLVTDGNIEYYDCTGVSTGCNVKLDAAGKELANVVIPARIDEVVWNLRWDGDNAVWDPVEGTDHYYVAIYRDGNRLDAGGSVHDTFYDASDGFRVWGPGKYTFEVRACVKPDKTVSTSPMSEEKDYVPPVVDLGEPTNAVWDGTVVRWDAAEYAEWYFLDLYKVGSKEPVESTGIKATKTEYDFSRDFEMHGSGTYYCEVYSSREFNVKGPAASKKIEYTAKIPKVQNAHWEGYTAKWDPVENAQYYDIAIYSASTSSYSGSFYGVTGVTEEGFYDLADVLEQYGCDKYTFEVFVVCDYHVGGLSDRSEVLDYHESIQNFPKEDATCTKSGVTAWSKCNACHEVVTPKKTIDKLPHTYDASWVCTVCGDEHTHALGKKHGVKAATDTANGNIEYYDCVGFGDGCDLKLDAEGKELTNVTIPAAKTIKLSATAYTYDGKAQTPAVTVKAGSKTLVKGTDYTVSYASGRKAVGTYKVVVKGKGDYSFTKTLTFKINPAKTAISKLTAAKKAFTVKWAKKTAQVSGYQIQYSLKKDFSSGNKLVTVKGMDNTAKTIKNLLAGKTYFVRVRTFKTVDGKNYTSAWSAVKSIKTLK